MPLTPYSWPTSIVPEGQPGATTGAVNATLAVYDRLTKIIGGWGARGPVVASSSSPQALQDTADYVCDGTADQAEINSAINTGRPPLLLPGTYSLAATVSLPSTGAAKVLQGCGWTTILDTQFDGDAVTFAPSVGAFMNGWVLRDFKIQHNGNVRTAGNGINAKGAVWCKFINLWINKPWGNGFWLRDDNLGSYGHHNLIWACLVDEGEQSNGGDGRAIYFDQSDENLVGGGTTLQANGRAAAGEPNHVFDPAGLNVGDGVFIVGGQTGWKFQGPDGRITNVTFDGCKNHSVRVNGARAQILGCHVYNVGYTGTNLDGIFVDNVDRPQIHDTTIDTIGSGQANGGSARSAINMSSGTVTNASIQGNRLLNTGVAYGTAPFIRGTGAGHLIADNQGGALSDLFARKTADTSRAATTAFADDPHLTLPVEANTVYELTGLIIYDGAATGDLKTTWSAPAGATLDWTPTGLLTSATVASGSLKMSHSALADNESVGTIGTGAGNRTVMRPTGLLVVGATAGSFTFRWAQLTSDATATTVLANSYTRLKRVS